MKFSETVASNCRYSEYLSPLLENHEVLAEDSLDDYQGCVNILTRDNDRNYYITEYSYGSCSGCDEWESLSDNEVKEAMQRSQAKLNEDEFDHFLSSLGESHWLHLYKSSQPTVVSGWFATT